MLSVGISDLTRVGHYHLVRGDCLGQLDALPSKYIQLAYVDPPFFTNRVLQKNRIAFDDRWGMNLQGYLDWMYDRLRKLPRVLTDAGTAYVHCDYHAGHYLKVMMDQIFGYGNFVNEIIWKRQSAHNDLKQGSQHFGRIHDTILVYAKTKNYKWNPTYEPYSLNYVQAIYKYVDQQSGRRYALGDLTGPGGAAKGNPEYTFLGVARAWRYSKEKMETMFREGKIVQSRREGSPRQKRYLDEMNGRPIQDVWEDIPPVKSRSKENSNYPTQKPTRLLERIVCAATDRGDVVLDPFCGSGTSGVASLRLGRRWIGIDTSADALAITERRLSKVAIVAETGDRPQIDN